MKWNNGSGIVNEKWEHKYCRAISRKVPLICVFFPPYSRKVANLYLLHFVYILRYIHTNQSNCRQISSINREICGSKCFSMIYSLLHLFYFENFERKNHKGRSKSEMEDFMLSTQIILLSVLHCFSFFFFV